jgi:circadian clock protein KaiB
MREKMKTLAVNEQTPNAVEKWLLRLYVAGRSPKCVTALDNLKRFCDERMAGRYDIEVKDLLDNPRLAKDDQFIAIPTLMRKLPEPLGKIIGNLSATERMLVGLAQVHGKGRPHLVDRRPSGQRGRAVGAGYRHRDRCRASTLHL